MDQPDGAESAKKSENKDPKPGEKITTKEKVKSGRVIKKFFNFLKNNIYDNLTVESD